MFKHEFQGGFSIEILSNQGAHPLQFWKITTTGLLSFKDVEAVTEEKQPGQVILPFMQQSPKKKEKEPVKKIYERSIKGFCFQIDGSHNKMCFPLDERKGARIVHPFLVIQAYSPLNHPLSIELGICDSGQTRRRLFFSPFLREPKVTPLFAGVPVVFPQDEWMTIVFDFNSLFNCLFKFPEFKTFENVTISGEGCKVRRIFTIREYAALEDGLFPSIETMVPRGAGFPEGIKSLLVVIDHVKGIPSVSSKKPEQSKSRPSSSLEKPIRSNNTHCIPTLKSTDNKASEKLVTNKKISTSKPIFKSNLNKEKPSDVHPISSSDYVRQTADIGNQRRPSTGKSQSHSSEHIKKDIVTSIPVSKKKQEKDTSHKILYSSSISRPESSLSAHHDPEKIEELKNILTKDLLSTNVAEINEILDDASSISEECSTKISSVAEIISADKSKIQLPVKASNQVKSMDHSKKSKNNSLNPPGTKIPKLSVLNKSASKIVPKMDSPVKKTNISSLKEIPVSNDTEKTKTRSPVRSIARPASSTNSVEKTKPPIKSVASSASSTSSSKQIQNHPKSIQILKQTSNMTSNEDKDSEFISDYYGDGTYNPKDYEEDTFSTAEVGSEDKSLNDQIISLKNQINNSVPSLTINEKSLENLDVNSIQVNSLLSRNSSVANPKYYEEGTFSAAEVGPEEKSLNDQIISLKNQINNSIPSLAINSKSLENLLDVNSTEVKSLLSRNPSVASTLINHSEHDSDYEDIDKMIQGSENLVSSASKLLSDLRIRAEEL